MTNDIPTVFSHDIIGLLNEPEITDQNSVDKDWV